MYYMERAFQSWALHGVLTLVAIGLGFAAGGHTRLSAFVIGMGVVMTAWNFCDGKDVELVDPTEGSA